MDLLSGYRFCDLFHVRKLRFASKLMSYSESALKIESIYICCEKKNFLKKSPYPPSGMVWSIMTIFSTTQPFLDGFFSSSNSTEILMRQFCTQNFSSIERNCEELSCKRTDTLTHSRVYPLFEYTKRRKMLEFQIGGMINLIPNESP